MNQVADIITNFLIVNKYDGLFNIDEPCACKMGDLWPCGDGPFTNCEAGVKMKCPKDEHCDCGSWHIGARKDVK